MYLVYQHVSPSGKVYIGIKVLKKHVVKLDTNFQVITIYDSICSASNDSNLSTDAIGNAIIRKTKSGMLIKHAKLGTACRGYYIEYDRI